MKKLKLIKILIIVSFIFQSTTLEKWGQIPNFLDSRVPRFRGDGNDNGKLGICPLFSLRPLSGKQSGTTPGAELSPFSATAARDPEERIVQIKELLPRVDAELDEAGSGNLPQVVVIADYHGQIALFLRYIADAIATLNGKQVELDPGVFPEQGIEKQLLAQGVNIKDINFTFYLLGDFLDRGEFGIKCFQVAGELVDLGVAKYVTGNHDLWAFLNVMEFHLPVYKGYNYGEGNEESRELVEEKYWDDPDIAVNRAKWWTEKLAEYNADQVTLEEEVSLPSFETVFKKPGIALKEARNAFKKMYLKIENDPSMEIKEKELWQDLIGFYFGETDVYTGLNGIGKMSVGWWVERANMLQQYIATRKSERAGRETVLPAEEKLLTCVKEAAELVAMRLKAARLEGKWWYQVFNDINNQNYTSVEWWGKDWSSHSGWGTSVIDELNKLEGEGKNPWNQTNYIHHPLLKELAAYYRENFTLFHKDPYGNVYTHGWLPVDAQTGEVRIEYKGVTYIGKDVWKGLEIIQQDVRDTSKELSEIREALSLVNSWYADKTTRAKPANVAHNVNILGLETIYDKLGIRFWVTCHNPTNKLAPRGVDSIVVQDGYVHILADKGMNYPKFLDTGGYVIVNADGIRIRGYVSPVLGQIDDNPPTMLLKKGAGDRFEIDKSWPNKPLEKEDYLNIVRLQLQEELKALQATIPGAGSSHPVASESAVADLIAQAA